MTEDRLHIISFDIPYPADYGGAIDVFYKIKSLKEAGIKIHLHCFEYGREHAYELEKLCEKVYYYKRSSFVNLFSGKPYIVASRKSSRLLKNLIDKEFPILFEGIHCCHYLAHPALKNRKKIVRMHNIEHSYYYNLFKAESNPFKKLYFLSETFKLKKFQKILEHATVILTISRTEYNYYKEIYPEKNIRFLPPFIKYRRPDIKPGKGDYILFHGNLSVAENKKAAIFLLHKLAYTKEMPLIIAGKNPDNHLTRLCRSKNIQLVANPSEEKMLELIQEAHINLLISFQYTGNKLKLFSALFNGRHCIANKAITDGSRLEKICHVCNSPEEISAAIKKLTPIAFTVADIEHREQVLIEKISNEKSATFIKAVLLETSDLFI